MTRFLMWFLNATGLGATHTLDLISGALLVLCAGAIGIPEKGPLESWGKCIQISFVKKDGIDIFSTSY